MKDKGKLSKWAYICAIIGTILYYILGKYSIIVIGRELDYIYARNFAFMAFPCFVIGYYIRENEDKIKNFKWGACSICSVLFLVIEYELLKYFEVNTLKHNYLCNIILAFCVILFAVKYQNIKDNLFAKIGRDYSLNIYLYHILINSWILILADKYKVLGSIYNMFKFLFVVLVCMILIWIINIIKAILIKKVFTKVKCNVKILL